MDVFGSRGALVGLEGMCMCFWMEYYHYVDGLLYMVMCRCRVVENLLPVVRIGSVFS